MKRRIRLTESDLHRIIKESVKRILKESNGLFDVYTNDHMQNAPVFVSYNGTLYQLPKEMEHMLRELGTRNGRINLLDAITNGQIEPSNIDVLQLKRRGYQSRPFNANAF